MEVLAVVCLINWIILTFKYSLIEPIHIIGTERWLQSAHLVEDTAKGPNIALTVIWLVSPDFRAGIVGCASLRVE